MCVCVCVCVRGGGGEIIKPDKTQNADNRVGE